MVMLVWVLGHVLVRVVVATPDPPPELLHVPRPPTRSPNVLFVAIDDMRPSIGAMGAPVHTPAMDKLATESLMFDRAFANFPWCNPSRNSLLSGRKPDTNKVWNFNVDLRTTFDQPPHSRHPGGPTGTNTSYVTLPQHFKLHGYYTTSAGKIFHSYNQIGSGMPINGDYPFSWSVPPTDHGKNGCDNSSTCRGGGPDQPGEYTGSCTWCNGDLHSGGVAGHSENNTYYADTAIATDAIGRLAVATASTQRRPWFVAAGFRDPHLPWRFPGKFSELYPAVVQHTNHSDIPHDPLAPMAWQYPVYFNGNYGNYWQLDSETHMQLSKEEVAIGTKAYFATISFTDSEIGRLLDAARALGQKAWDEMVVILWSDHGQNVGEHGTWCKMAAWEHSLRVALIIKPAVAYSGSRAPIISPATYAGKTYRGPVELLDIYKTTVELAGLPSPQPGVQGDSLVPVFSAPTVPIKDFAISQTTRCHVSSQGISGSRYIEPATAQKYFAACVRTPRTDFDFMGYSIRTSEWRYTGWFTWLNITSATNGPGPDLSSGPVGEELYDHRNDTSHYDVDDYEYVNLANQPDLKATRDRLLAQLTREVASWQK